MPLLDGFTRCTADCVNIGSALDKHNTCEAVRIDELIHALKR
jgi:hypothetical protein